MRNRDDGVCSVRKIPSGGCGHFVRVGCRAGGVVDLHTDVAATGRSLGVLATSSWRSGCRAKRVVGQRRSVSQVVAQQSGAGGLGSTGGSTGALPGADLAGERIADGAVGCLGRLALHVAQLRPALGSASRQRQRTGCHGGAEALPGWQRRAGDIVAEEQFARLQYHRGSGVHRAIDQFSGSGAESLETGRRPQCDWALRVFGRNRSDREPDRASDPAQTDSTALRGGAGGG